jgi:hypothetical protein
MVAVTAACADRAMPDTIVQLVQIATAGLLAL